MMEMDMSELNEAHLAPNRGTRPDLLKKQVRDCSIYSQLYPKDGHYSQNCKGSSLHSKLINVDVLNAQGYIDGREARLGLHLVQVAYEAENTEIHWYEGSHSGSALYRGYSLHSKLINVNVLNARGKKLYYMCQSTLAEESPSVACI